MKPGKRPDILVPFKNAFSGVVYTFRTQRHMRFHIYVVIIVLLLGTWLNLGLREVLVLLFTVSLVMVAEMFNSAIEATVDLVSPNYHPLAKFAKDIAAGAVLITTFIALVVGALLILGENRWEEIRTSLTATQPALNVVPRLLIGMLALFFAVVIGKGLGKRGEVMRGGLVSGHSAYSFFIASAIVWMSNSIVITSLAIMLACIVAQSRWEAKIHSIFEVTLGAAVGVAFAALLFGLLPK